MSSTERKMAAIVAMDVTSYSEKMGRDEDGTLKHLRACREIIETVVAENRGRVFNTAGDAFMIEFSSAVSALSAAVEIQKLIKNRNDSLEEIERMYFRMGVNVGDVMRSSIPSAAPKPCVKAVLPAPRSPARSTRSPGRANSASAAASSFVCSGEVVRAKIIHSPLVDRTAGLGAQFHR